MFATNVAVGGARGWYLNNGYAIATATNVNGNLIPRKMGDIPDVTIQYQQFDKKPLKFSARAHYILVPVIVTEKDRQSGQRLGTAAGQLRRTPLLWRSLPR